MAHLVTACFGRFSGWPPRLEEHEPQDLLAEIHGSDPAGSHGLGSNYTHAALYEGDGKFLEATTHGGVQRFDLEKYFNDTVKVAVIKMPCATEAEPSGGPEKLPLHSGQALQPHPETSSRPPIPRLLAAPKRSLTAWRTCPIRSGSLGPWC